MTNVYFNGIEYAPVAQSSDDDLHPEDELRLTIIDTSGLTFVGYVDLTSKERMLTIKNARCVIQWGVEKHLAELINGPKDKTVLGDEATVQVRNDVVASYKATGDWYAR